MFIMERKLSYVVFQEDDAFVARCLDVEVASDGTSEQEAVDNLREALELYFEDNGESVGSPGTALQPSRRARLSNRLRPRGLFERRDCSTLAWGVSSGCFARFVKPCPFDRGMPL
jgi:predicted RNase H-like HicB family nuclease